MWPWGAGRMLRLPPLVRHPYPGDVASACRGRPHCGNGRDHRRRPPPPVCATTVAGPAASWRRRRAMPARPSRLGHAARPTPASLSPVPPREVAAVWRPWRRRQLAGRPAGRPPPPEPAAAAVAAAAPPAATRTRPRRRRLAATARGATRRGRAAAAIRRGRLFVRRARTNDRYSHSREDPTRDCFCLVWTFFSTFFFICSSAIKSTRRMAQRGYTLARKPLVADFTMNATDRALGPPSAITSRSPSASSE